MYVLRNSMRKLLAFPYGIAIYAEPPKSIDVLKSLVEDFEVEHVVSVGDVVTYNMLKYGLKPDLAVVDSKTRRLEAVEVDPLEFDVVIYARNSAGTISRSALRAVLDCAKLIERGRRAIIVVDGEEDLLALPIIAYAPRRTLVAYGLYTGSLLAIPVDGYRGVAARLLEMMEQDLKPLSLIHI